MTEPIRVVVVGAGGHGREVCDVVELLAASGTHQLVGVLDDDPGPHHLLLQRGVPHLGPIEVATELPGPTWWALGVGDPTTRRSLDERLTALGVQPASLVHPAASIGAAGRYGPGLLLAAGARVTTNVTTGRHVHLNVNATVSHDCVLGDHVILNPGAAVTGGVTLGNGVMVGAGAVVRQGTTIGDGAVVGAGAVVVDDVAPGTTVVGVPARPLDPR